MAELSLHYEFTQSSGPAAGHSLAVFDHGLGSLIAEAGQLRQFHDHAPGGDLMQRRVVTQRRIHAQGVGHRRCCGGSDARVHLARLGCQLRVLARFGQEGAGSVADALSGDAGPLDSWLCRLHRLLQSGAHRSHHPAYLIAEPLVEPCSDNRVTGG
jgi:hypothetical protein